MIKFTCGERSQIKFTTIFIVLFLIIGCREKTEPVEMKDDIVTEDIEIMESEDMDFLLPQPITLVKALEEAGLTYDEKNINPYTKKNKYIKKSSQILNFGVYSADLAYCIINKEKQTALNYLKTLREIAPSIGLESVFSDKELLKKFETEIENPEMLEELVYLMQEKMDDYLADNDMKYLAVVEFAGAWVEGMHIGMNEFNETTSVKLKAALTDQMNLVENTIKGLEKYPNSDELISAVVSRLSELQNTYNNFESVKIAKNSENHSSPILTSEEVGKLALIIKETRELIVGK